jgi:hypothetical protein
MVRQTTSCPFGEPMDMKLMTAAERHRKRSSCCCLVLGVGRTSSKTEVEGSYHSSLSLVLGAAGHIRTTLEDHLHKKIVHEAHEIARGPVNSNYVD